MRFNAVIFITILFFIGLCSFLLYRPNIKNNFSKKKVVCTTGMIASVVHEIAGDLLDIVCLMGPGVDPHVYKTKPTDVLHIQEAHLLLYNGLHLEGKMVELFEELHKTKKVCAVSSWCDNTLLIKVSEQAYDPHIWHDILLWQQIVVPLAKELCLIDPEHTAYFIAQAEKYTLKLTTLHNQIKDSFATIPAQKRVLVTAHDAFNYFGRAYGFEVVALQGVSTDVQPGLADMVTLVDLIIAKNISVIFVESCIPKKSIEAVVQMAQRRGHTLQMGKELLADALGDQEKNADTYVGMMYYNMRTIMDGYALHGMPAI